MKKAATEPPNVANNPIPTAMRTTPKILPRSVTGEMSPYPTVVVVTTAHHTPFHTLPTDSGSYRPIEESQPQRCCHRGSGQVPRYGNEAGQD